MPESSCGEIIDYSYYSVSFCEQYRLSEWAIYYMTPDRFGSTRRTDNFRQDPQLNGRDASLYHFKGSGYDRGHLVPAADMTWDIERISETFFMTNISPKSPSFNRGGNKELESKIREWIIEFDTVAIITGWVTSDIQHYISEDSIPVPNYFYKVFIDIQRKRSIAFLLPNMKITKPIMEYVISIDYLESITGLDFFYKLPDNIEILFEMDTGNNEIKGKK